MGKSSQSRPIIRVTTADIVRQTGVQQSTLYRWKANKPKLYAELEYALRVRRALENIG